MFLPLIGGDRGYRPGPCRIVRRGMSHILIITLIDLKEIFFHIIKPVAEKPIILLAHSMGGHVAIRFAHDFPGAVDQLILSAPMMDIYFKPLPKFLVRGYVHFMTAARKAESYALGSSDYNVEKQQFKGNKLTSDPDRFLDHVNCRSKKSGSGAGGCDIWMA